MGNEIAAAGKKSLVFTAVFHANFHWLILWCLLPLAKNRSEIDNTATEINIS